LSPALDHPEALRARFAALTAFLKATYSVWHPRAFVERPVAWEADFPQISAHLDALDLTAFETSPAPSNEGAAAPPALEGRRWLVDAPAPLGAWAAEAETLGTLGLDGPHPAAARDFGTLGVPGRKLSQIEHFLAPVLARWPQPTRVADWCAGKGHLGRALCHHTGAALLAFEWQAALCAAGEAGCRRAGVAAEFVCGDVRTPEARQRLQASDLVVALHACGGLHTALLRATVAQRVAGLALAPCCYNQPAPDRGQPLSQAGVAAGLTLDENDLDLLHRQPVTAGAGRMRRSQQAQVWRLALDALLRSITGVDHYRPMPPFSSTWLALPFREFCQRLAAEAGLVVPDTVDAEAFLPAGEAAYAETVRRDAVRGLFAAPLEAWLVLDRALFLVEAGYVVEVTTFCPRSLTPRNALLRAWAPGGAMPALDQDHP